MATPRFDNFEVVRIRTSNFTRELEIAGTEGVILGVSQEGEGPIHYAVSIFGLDRGVMVAEEDIEPTGRRVAEEDIYDGTSIRVTDEGRLVEGEEDDD